MVHNLVNIFSHLGFIQDIEHLLQLSLLRITVQFPLEHHDIGHLHVGLHLWIGKLSTLQGCTQSTTTLNFMSFGFMSQGLKIQTTCTTKQFTPHNSLAQVMIHPKSAA